MIVALNRNKPYRLGPPRGLRDSGPSGEVITYKLSEEELEKYRALPKPTGEDAKRPVFTDHFTLGRLRKEQVRRKKEVEKMAQEAAVAEKKEPEKTPEIAGDTLVEGVIAEMSGELIVIDDNGVAKYLGEQLVQMINDKRKGWLGKKISIRVDVA